MSRAARWLQHLVLLVLLGGSAYAAYSFYVPCRTPVVYSVGSLDARFNLSREELQEALADAEDIWERAVGKDMFAYSASGGMPVNLVYDARQATTLRNNDIKEVIDKKTGSAESLKSAYENALQTYEAAKTAYVAAKARYEAALKAYNERVASVNARGGASGGEYRSLQAEKQRLEQESGALEEKRLALNTHAEEVNALSADYNAVVDDVNEHVEQINQTAGREFEEGLYVKRAWGSRIDIYEYSTREELVRVLAHELGHALGLEHNTNPDSIMYELNESKNMKPTQEDLAGLKEVCGI